jgi:O-6-methylguanine DNA methyltransferase
MNSNESPDEAPHVRTAYHPSPIGPLEIRWSAAGLHAVRFTDPESDPAAGREPLPAPIAATFAAYFSGKPHALDALRIAPVGTVFQRRVWAALRAIPPGRTLSYGALAAALGSPSAARAVGRAAATNPVGLVVPCHRVVGRDGALTGFLWGLDRKRWLLAHEAAHLRGASDAAGGSEDGAAA